MLVVILSILLVGIGVVIGIFAEQRNLRFTSKVSVASMFAGVVILILSIIFIGGRQLFGRADYKTNIEIKQALEYRMSEGFDELDDYQLYRDIMDFNNDLCREKTLNSNPWTNWFVYDRIAEIEYINYKE